jgi:hypothetical protein
MSTCYIVWYGNNTKNRNSAKRTTRKNFRFETTTRRIKADWIKEAISTKRKREVIKLNA